MLAIKYKLTPVLFALLSVAIVGLLASHLAFYFEDAAGMTCHQSASATKLLSGHRTPELTFDPKSECWASGIILTRGVRYVVSLKTSEDWADGNYRADAGGYGIDTLPSWWDRAKMIVTVPLRRVLLRPWFRIIARVGETGTDEYFLDPDAADVRSLEIPFVAHRTGELYLYVNDAVLPVRKDFFYRTNKGTATLTVTQKDKH